MVYIVEVVVELMGCWFLLVYVCEEGLFVWICCIGGIFWVDSVLYGLFVFVFFFEDLLYVEV